MVEQTLSHLEERCDANASFSSVGKALVRHPSDLCSERVFSCAGYVDRRTGYASTPEHLAARTLIRYNAPKVAPPHELEPLLTSLLSEPCEPSEGSLNHAQQNKVDL